MKKILILFLIAIVLVSTIYMANKNVDIGDTSPISPIYLPIIYER